LDEGLDLLKVVGSQFAREVGMPPLHKRPTKREPIEIGGLSSSRDGDVAAATDPRRAWQNTPVLT
jgi:hypothetical protein